jgi:hypothetical protein
MEAVVVIVIERVETWGLHSDPRVRHVTTR